MSRIVTLFIGSLWPTIASAAAIFFKVTGGESTVSAAGFQSTFDLRGHGLTGTGSIAVPLLRVLIFPGSTSYHFGPGLLALDFTDGIDTWHLAIPLESEAHILDAAAFEHDLGDVEFRRYTMPAAMAAHLQVASTRIGSAVTLRGQLTPPGPSLPRDFTHDGSRLLLRGKRSVPEPFTLALLAVGAVAVFRQRASAKHDRKSRSIHR